MKQKRGHLTFRVDAMAKKMLGRSITQTELRLMPYVQYVMVNEQWTDRIKMNDAERRILDRWTKLGWVKWTHPDLTVTKKFWDAMLEILYLAYVDIE